MFLEDSHEFAIYDISPGFAGDTTFVRRVYVDASTTNSRTALFLPASVMSFATKKCPRHSTYCVHSSSEPSNSSTFPNTVAISPFLCQIPSCHQFIKGSSKIYPASLPNSQCGRQNNS